VGEGRAMIKVSRKVGQSAWNREKKGKASGKEKKGKVFNSTRRNMRKIKGKHPPPMTPCFVSLLPKLLSGFLGLIK
jgi:hypothetical protein